MSNPCHCCGGSGRELDHAGVGRKLVQTRKAAGVSQKTMAAQLGISCPYLSQLEHGKRRWPMALIEKYRKICGKTAGH